MKVYRHCCLAAAILAHWIVPADAQTPPSPPPPDKKVSITLTVEQWNAVLQALGSQPYERVQPLITEMQTQAAPQIAAPPTPPEKKGEKK